MEEFKSNQGDPGNLDISNKNLVSQAASIEDLFDVLRKIGEIQGTGKQYTAEKLIDYIERIKKGEMDIAYLPRTHGLRDKVDSMLRS